MPRQQIGRSIGILFLALSSVVFGHRLSSADPITTVNQQAKLAALQRNREQLKRLCDQGKLEEALPLGERIAKTAKEIVGPQNLIYTDNMKQLVWLYAQAGHASLAISCCQELLNIRKETRGSNSLEYAESLNDLGALYADMCQFDNAKPLFKEAASIRNDVMGVKSRDYATSP